MGIIILGSLNSSSYFKGRFIIYGMGGGILGGRAKSDDPRKGGGGEPNWTTRLGGGGLKSFGLLVNIFFKSLKPDLLCFGGILGYF